MWCVQKQCPPTSCKACFTSGGTFSLLDKFLPAKCGITTTFVSIADHAAVAAAITDRTKVSAFVDHCDILCLAIASVPSICCCLLQVLYTESLSNPTLVVSDIPGLATIAHDRVRVFADIC